MLVTNQTNNVGKAVPKPYCKVNNEFQKKKGGYWVLGWSSERTASSDCGGKKSKEEGDVAEELKKALKGAS
ncbi:hypothetical protein IGI04_013233 [Brassica rapa subsp. trilocularis]|uniref:BnaA03g47850D protein n=4 Tax=Brassica TaxID=3705 RepID=A0A078HZI2_BRANA|nr:hypothetical protein IGI04_013233 [Brassica rapa subsp. trilocularis]KAH0935592.1 hypothetical protein HID58_012709 [Brassica napus]CAF2131460.1 unnamed protein product [Brassica napus]CDY42754.1 BnaA03g47850D [Brassica napus]